MTGTIDRFVRVRGARLHNLQAVAVQIPRGCLAVFTGVSGSGKSSLAFGTIYAEAQRRYFESVAPYARRLIRQVESPQVAEITGLPPAVALQQGHAAPSGRSTVGTVTTLSNLLRMLYSRAGDYPAGARRLDSDSFSANTPNGACPQCHGLGLVHRPTEALMVPDPSLSIRQKAIAAWPGAWMGKNLRDILAALGHDVDRPWRELPAQERDWILFTQDEPVVTVWAERDPARIHRPYQGTYVSAARYVLRTLAGSNSATSRKRMLQFVQRLPCPACGGRRLRPQALAVTFAGRDIAATTALPLADLHRVLQPLADPDGVRHTVAGQICADLSGRIDVLLELGLGYLPLSRATPTLSAGELQRLRLATQLRAGLFGVLYVLDEPSAGLHPADIVPLMGVLDSLVAAGNSLFVVEHDPEVIRRAAWVVDVGPGAGVHGGKIVYAGPPAALPGVAESATGRYLDAGGAGASGSDGLSRSGPAARTRPARTPSGRLNLTGISLHNLHDVTLELPLGVLTAVTGVSGSGKTTLIVEVLGDVVARHLAGTRSARHTDDEASDDGASDDEEMPGSELPLAVAAVAVQGLSALRRLVRVDQRPIGRTPRSNLATYTGLFDGVRKLFAATPAARELGYDAGRFSFNMPAGRCETCQGEGFVAVELLFLPGSYATCPTCQGARYNPETLAVRYRGATVADVLAQTVDEARAFFTDIPAVARSLRLLAGVGLGYLRLGQPATELSGGEAQRIKLATELQRARGGQTLYLLDEPTSGLHPADVDVLIAQLGALVEAGNTVVLIEHDMRVVAGADHVIDLGPGGGEAGGQIVAAGTPTEVAASAGSVTAPFLAAELAGQSAVTLARQPVTDVGRG